MAVWLIWYQRGDWVFLWESEQGDEIWGWVLLGWLWTQVVVLLAQEIFGPRFFISSTVRYLRSFLDLLLVFLESGLLTFLVAASHLQLFCAV